MSRRTFLVVGLSALSLAITTGCGGGDSAPLPKGKTLTLRGDGQPGSTVTIESNRKTNVGLAEFVPLPEGTAVTVVDDDQFSRSDRREVRTILVEVADGPSKGLVGRVGRHKLRP